MGYIKLNIVGNMKDMDVGLTSETDEVWNLGVL